MLESALPTEELKEGLAVDPDTVKPSIAPEVKKIG